MSKHGSIHECYIYDSSSGYIVRWVHGCRKSGASGEKEGGREGGGERSLEGPDVGHIVYTGDDTYAVLLLHSLNILYVLDCF